MTRYLLPLALLSACAPFDEVTGKDGIPEFTWEGGNVETLTVTDVDDTIYWNIEPEPFSGACTNVLDPEVGVVWNELPEGYANVQVDFAFEDQEQLEEAPATLEDGDYRFAVARCFDAQDNGIRSYQRDYVADFTVEDGTVTLTSERCADACEE